MKHFFVIPFLMISINLMSQISDTRSTTADSWNEEFVNEGYSTENGKAKYALIIIHSGDLKSITDRLLADLGRGEWIRDDGMHKELVIRKITKTE